MTTGIRNVIAAACAVAAVLSIGLLAEPASAASVRRDPNGAVRFYDDRGQDRGYAWCRTGGFLSGGASGCNYYTIEQCRGSGFSGGGYCVPNPWSYYVDHIPAQRLQLQ